MNAGIILVHKIEVALAKRRILNNISFCVSRGEHLVLIGTNGAGKTTLLKTLAGIYIPQSGTLQIAGRELSHYSRRELARKISYVPQLVQNLPAFEVEEFLLMSRYPHVAPYAAFTAKDEEAVRTAIQHLDLGAFCGRRLDQLSAGETQRVLIASALAQGAEILLLDEPLTFLDPAQQETARNSLMRLKEIEGLTLITVTHDLNFAMSNASHVLGLSQGRVAFYGTAKEAACEDALRRLFGIDFLLIDHPQRHVPVVLYR